jgi:hypothetical protein
MPFNSSHDSPDDTRVSHREPNSTVNNALGFQEGYTQFTKNELLYKPPKGVNDSKYIKSGNNNAVPQYNSTELYQINGGIEKSIIDYYRAHPDIAQEMEGAGIGHFFKKVGETVKKSAKNTGETLKKSAKNTGKTLKKSATEKDGILRQVISATADVALPAVGTALGTAVGAYYGNPEAGKEVGKKVGTLSRSILKQKTGYGVGEYKGGASDASKKVKATKSLVQKEINKAIEQYLPETRDVMGYGKPEPVKEVVKEVVEAVKKPSVNVARQARNVIVKRIMAERNVNLPTASKIVKMENLFSK